jgi:hypothetical protein
VHPQGSRYFVNAERVRQIHALVEADGLSHSYNKQRTFTQMNICDEEVYSHIKDFMDYLLRSLRDESEDLELDMAQVDLVIEPKVSTDADTVVCCYYFANHRDRCLFWLDEYSTEDILSECNGVENLSHIRAQSMVLSVSGIDDSSWFSNSGLAIQAQYWCALLF